MENWEQFIQKTINLLGFRDCAVEFNDEHRHSSIFIHDDPSLVKENLPLLVESINYLVQLVARKNAWQPIYVDINNYRKERENLIIELVRATTRKVVATQQSMSLPAMNSYERRLAHLELATHPEVTTESVGKGRGRYVVIKLIQVGEGAPRQAQESIGDSEPARFEKIIEDIQGIREDPSAQAGEDRGGRRND